MTIHKISSLAGLAAAVAAQSNESEHPVIPPGVSAEKAISLSYPNMIKFKEWKNLQQNALHGALYFSEMMHGVMKSVCEEMPLQAGEIILASDNSLLVVREDGILLNPESKKIRLADHEDFSITRVDSLYRRFAEQLSPYFSALSIPIEKRLISEMHLFALQSLQTQYEKEALISIWKLHLARRFHLQDDPNLQTLEQIRAAMNTPLIAMLLQQMTRLELRFCDLKTLPPEISRLNGLEELNLSNRRSSLSPDEFLVRYSYNQLTSLPSELCRLTALRVLDLSYNQLTSLPNKLDSLTALEELDLSYNQLISLPRELGSLTALRMLDLACNKLSSLPRELGSLTTLRVLDLSNNRLKSIPKQIGYIRTLHELNLVDNPLMFIPDKELSKSHTFISGQKLSISPKITTIFSRYKDFMSYKTHSFLGDLFKLIATTNDPVRIQNAFDKLDPAMQQRIAELARVPASTGASSSSASSSSSLTIDTSLFDDIPRLGCAIKKVAFAMFDKLSLPQKKKVYRKIWELAGRPKTNDSKWGEHNVFNNMLRFADALEKVRCQS